MSQFGCHQLDSANKESKKKRKGSATFTYVSKSLKILENEGKPLELQESYSESTFSLVQYYIAMKLTCSNGKGLKFSSSSPNFPAKLWLGDFYQSNLNSYFPFPVKERINTTIFDTVDGLKKALQLKPFLFVLCASISDLNITYDQNYNINP